MGFRRGAGATGEAGGATPSRHRKLWEGPVCLCLHRCVMVKSSQVCVPVSKQIKLYPLIMGSFLASFLFYVQRRIPQWIKPQKAGVKIKWHSRLRISIFSEAAQVRSPSWRSGLRIWHYHSCSLGLISGSDLNPDTRTCIRQWCGQKRR